MLARNPSPASPRRAGSMGFASLNPSYKVCCPHCKQQQKYNAEQREPGAILRALGRDRARCRRRDALERAVGRCADRVIPYSRCQTAQSSSFPRRVSASGFCFSLSIRPRTEGRAERRQAHYFIGRADRRATGHACEARRVPQRRDARLSALHRGDFGSGAALPSPAFPPDPCSDAPRSQVVVPGGRGPGPPGAVGYEPRPQDATPRSAFRIVSRRRPS